ncbi:MAG: sulfotransferase [Actinomycetota bacterium]|nr:sulfotransferase [Actinomycetota bacterium]
MNIANTSNTKVLYVLGRGRSGSTIFANTVAAHEGWFSAGELRYLWDPVAVRDRDCACGRPISACPVWSKVLDDVSDISPEAAAAWQREVVTERNLARLLRYRDGGTWPALEHFIAVMSRVYRSLARVTGANVIVDSSKRPSYAAVVRLLPRCDLYAIHLIRDPRASAYSWATSHHASVFGDGAQVRRRNALDSTIRWNVLNLEAELVLRRLGPQRGMRVRYEDFVAAPRAETAEVARFLGAGDVASPFRDEKTVRLGPNHTIAGNPSRFAVGEVAIQDSADWRVKQRPLDRRVATAAALPFLYRYGYRARWRSPR